MKGFTLLEAILSIVLAALLATVLVSLFQKAVVADYAPIATLRAGTQLANATEAVIADYDASEKDAASLATLATKVNDFQANYGDYCSECTGGAEMKTVGNLSNCLVVTIKNSDGGTTHHVFTVQKY